MAIHPLPAMQLAEELKRPIQHEDYHEGVEVREFMAGLFTRMLRRAAPSKVSSMPVFARLDAGRWIADCPMGCNGAEMVTTVDPIFLCLSCGCGDMWWPGEFPPNKMALDNNLKRRVDVQG